MDSLCFATVCFASVVPYKETLLFCKLRKAGCLETEQSIAQDNEIEMKDHFIFLSSFPAILCFVAYYNAGRGSSSPPYAAYLCYNIGARFILARLCSLSQRLQETCR